MAAAGVSTEVPLQILITRTEITDEKVYLLLTHKDKSVDWKMNPVVPEGEGWRYKDSFDYPETTGYFSVNDEGIIKFFALVPKKYCMTFVPQADGSWVIKDSSAKVETAVKVVDLKPEPSLLGAGGLPKGAINLGEEADEGFNALW